MTDWRDYISFLLLWSFYTTLVIVETLCAVGAFTDVYLFTAFDTNFWLEGMLTTSSGAVVGFCWMVWKSGYRRIIIVTYICVVVAFLVYYPPAAVHIALWSVWWRVDSLVQRRPSTVHSFCSGCGAEVETKVVS